MVWAHWALVLSFGGGMCGMGGSNAGSLSPFAVAETVEWVAWALQQDHHLLLVVAVAVREVPQQDLCLHLVAAVWAACWKQR